jgi:BirA family biotin operon repressor/biotin-[acetyl-CoA-carboxylase] ligase
MSRLKNGQVFRLHGGGVVADVDRPEVRRAGVAAFPGFSLRVLARTASTQDVVRAAARDNAEAGFCCVAAEQTAGRGRQGRRWSAPPDTALLMSILLRPSPEALAGLTLAAGLAVVDAIRSSAGVSCGLKWPNDILIDGRKLAGILAEREPGGSGGVALGFGINLTVRGFPAAVKGVSLDELCSRPPGAGELLQALLPALGQRLDALEVSGVAGLRESWTAAAVGLGGTVRAQSGGSEISGTALGIDDSGALIVETATGPVSLVAGDVHLMP